MRAENSKAKIVKDYENISYPMEFRVKRKSLYMEIPGYFVKIKSLLAFFFSSNYDTKDGIHLLLDAVHKSVVFSS